MRLSLFCSALLLFNAPILLAQEAEEGVDPLSTHPVDEGVIAFKKLLWWRIDLNEKQNSPFFSRENEISTILIEAVKEGVLVPYVDDKVEERMSPEAFLEALKYPHDGGGLTEEEKALGFEDASEDWGIEEPEPAEEEEYSDEYDTRDFSVLEIREGWFFDKLRSRMYHDVYAVTLVLPADRNPALYEKPLASFRFVDLVELFRGMPKRAIWYNSKNAAAHLNMADAFELRLFNAVLVKVSNPRDDRIVDVYSNSRDEAIRASKKLELQLVDFETQLWEY